MASDKRYYVVRRTGEKIEEPIWRKTALFFLFTSKMGRPFGFLLAEFPFFSQLIGWWYRKPWTRKMIPDFVKRFGINTAEFEQPVESYPSFNAFFVRALKKECRPLANGAVMPADGRYLFYQDISIADSFVVKNKKFSVEKIIGDEQLAKSYSQGSMVLINLSPYDCHRFYFPCDCIPGPSRLINGFLYPTHPLLLVRNIAALSENKRMITELKTEVYGTILFIEIGAMAVGSIHQTYEPGRPYKKGDEKGYFSFGGSSLILLFERGKIELASDILAHTSKGMETLCRLGESLSEF